MTFTPSLFFKHAFAHPKPFSLIVGVGIALAVPCNAPAYAAGVVGTGTAASCTETALSSALAGGGNVTFNCGNSLVTIAVTSEKLLLNDTTVDGGDLVTLSGGGKSRIFRTGDNGVTFTVKNLTVIDGFTTEEGAGIRSGYKGKLTVINCKFYRNVSTQVSGDGGGGAIAAASESTVIVDKSVFTDNKATNGGAIKNLLSDLTVTNSVFTGNSAIFSSSGGAGGAVYIDGANGDKGKLVFRGNTFTSNKGGLGGGIFIQLYSSNTATVDTNTFTDNSVTGENSQGIGGAIFNVGGQLGPGPGLVYKGGPNETRLTATNNTFSGNSATNQGGAIWSGNNASANIINDTIASNSAVSADGKGGIGGGLSIPSGKVNITNSTIALNYAGFLGAGIVGGTNVTLRNTIIAFNKANSGGHNWNVKNNCSQVMTNGGNNIQFPATKGYDPNDIDCAPGIFTADPKLGPLSNNGGPTQTMQIWPGSPAINTGNNATCPATDQRGVPRPQGGICDIGAFEAK